MENSEINPVMLAQSNNEIRSDSSEITLYTAKDIQKIFHCGRKKAYEIMHIQGFPSFRIDSSIYVEKNELKKWISRIKNKNINT